MPFLRKLIDFLHSFPWTRSFIPCAIVQCACLATPAHCTITYVFTQVNTTTGRRFGLFERKHFLTEFQTVRQRATG